MAEEGSLQLPPELSPSKVRISLRKGLSGSQHASLRRSNEGNSKAAFSARWLEFSGKKRDALQDVFRRFKSKDSNGIGVSELAHLVAETLLVDSYYMLTGSKVEGRNVTYEHAHLIMRQLDQDGDDVLSFEDFVEAYQVLLTDQAKPSAVYSSMVVADNVALYLSCQRLIEELQDKANEMNKQAAQYEKEISRLQDAQIQSVHQQERDMEDLESDYHTMQQQLKALRGQLRQAKSMQNLFNTSSETDQDTASLDRSASGLQDAPLSQLEETRSLVTTPSLSHSRAKSKSLHNMSGRLTDRSRSNSVTSLDMEQEIHRMSRELHSSDQKANEFRGQISRLKRRERELRLQLKDTRSALVDVRSSLEAANRENASLHEQVALLQVELEDARFANADTGRRMSMADYHLHNLSLGAEMELQTLRDENEQLRLEVDALRQAKAQPTKTKRNTSWQPMPPPPSQVRPASSPQLTQDDESEDKVDQEKALKLKLQISRKAAERLETLLDREINAHDDARSHLRRVINEKEKLASKLVTLRQEHGCQVDELRKTISSLRDEVASLEQDVALKTSKIKDLETDLEEASSKIAHEQQQAMAARSDQDKLKEHVRRLESDNAAVQAELTSARLSLATAQQRRDFLETDSKVQAERNATLQAENEALKRRLEHTQDAVRQKTEAQTQRAPDPAKELREQLDLALREQARLQSAMSSVQAQLQAKTRAAEETASSLSAAQQAMKAASEREEALRAAKEHQTSLAREAMTELQRTREQLERQREETFSVRSQLCDALNKSVSQGPSSSDAAKIAKLKRRVRELEDELDDVEGQRNALQLHLDALTSTSVSLRAALASRSAPTGPLLSLLPILDQLSQLRQEHRRRRASTLRNMKSLESQLRVRELDRDSDLMTCWDDTAHNQPHQANSARHTNGSPRGLKAVFPDASFRSSYSTDGEDDTQGGSLSSPSPKHVSDRHTASQRREQMPSIPESTWSHTGDLMAPVTVVRAANCPGVEAASFIFMSDDGVQFLSAGHKLLRQFDWQTISRLDRNDDQQLVLCVRARARRSASIDVMIVFTSMAGLALSTYSNRFLRSTRSLRASVRRPAGKTQIADSSQTAGFV